MSEWVKGPDVDWEGFAEMRDANGGVHPGAVSLRYGRYYCVSFLWGNWLPCDSSGCKFRRVTTADPELVKDGERWRRIQEKLLSLENDTSSIFTLRSNDIWEFAKGSGEDVQKGWIIEELDDYLAEPQPKRFYVNQKHVDLLPGQEVEDGELIIKRKEQP